ncbi:hypothetical protein AEQU1_00117 [Aequorivita sp. CIP111184]|nr:hypothetical protein AEQU1_00117 [Aequorivita sp. CIP111184]
MPNRNVEGSYRYGYQGEFAETDPETGMPAFELRLWDARIGRWLTTDPYKQHFSPYMGMGNNPISFTDPDGGSDCPNKPCNQGEATTFNYLSGEYEVDLSTGFTLEEVVVTAPQGVNGIDGKNFINGAIVLYGISQGASGTIRDFDQITDALKKQTFLSREFNQAGELRPYKLNPDGTAAYKGGGPARYKAEDVTKAASKFKATANTIKVVKAIGVAGNIVGVGLSVHQIYLDGEVTLVNGMDTSMGLVAFIPGVGWVLSGSYSIFRATIPMDRPYDYRLIGPKGIHRFGEGG